jgi:hypothetical protein
VRNKKRYQYKNRNWSLVVIAVDLQYQNKYSKLGLKMPTGLWHTTKKEKGEKDEKNCFSSGHGIFSGQPGWL